jgi:membrane protein
LTGVGENLRRFREAVRQSVAPGEEHGGRTRRALIVAARLVIQMGRQFNRDRCPRQAASLSFATLLAFVPLASVLLALTRWVDRLADRPAVERILQRFLLPDAASDLAVRIAELVQRVDFAAIGWVGAAALVPLGGLLFLQVEDVLNDIWRVPRSRPWWLRLAVLFGIMVFALPVLVAAIVLSLERLAAPLDVLVPALLALAGLTITYKLMPHIRVRWRSALAGGAVATVLLGAGHELFGAYLDRFGWTYESVYGAIALVPAALFWVYLSWLFFLLGAEVTYTGQHLHALWARARYARAAARGGPDVVRAVSWPNAVRLLAEVADAEEVGRGPIDVPFAALRLGLHTESVRLIAYRLIEVGFLGRDPEGYLVLGRPAAEIRLADVHRAVIDDPVDLPPLQEILRGERDALAERTLADRSLHRG